MHGVTHLSTVGSEEGWSEITHFSPDGSKIAYTWWSYPGEGYEVRVRNTDGTGERVLWRAADEAPVRTRSGIGLWWPAIYGWTPDGSSVVASLWSSRNSAAIWLMPLDGSPKRHLYQPAPGKHLGEWVAVSPDGQFLAFDERAVASPERPETPSNLFVLPLEGEDDPVAIAPSDSEDVVVGWTIDGGLLFFSDREQTEGVWSVAIRNGRPVGEPSLLKGDLWGAQPFGVAGDAIYFGIRTQARRLHTVGLSLESRRLVGELRPVEAVSRPSNRPSWSPDGRYLAYRAESRRDRPSLMIRSASGNSVQEVGPFQRIRDLSWDPSGNAIHIAGELPGDDQKFSWFRFDLGTGETVRTRRSIDGIGCASPILLHPDGQRQFCTRRRDGTRPRQFVELDLGTSEPRVLQEMPRVPTGPVARWGIASLSPDGSRFAIWAYETREDWSLRIMPVDGNEPTEVLRFDMGTSEHAECFGHRMPLWLPDGEHLLIERPSALAEGEEPGSDACSVDLVSVAGGPTVEIGTLPEHDEWTLSPDGTRLAIVTGESRGEFWVLEPAR